MKLRVVTCEGSSPGLGWYEHLHTEWEAASLPYICSLILGTVFELKVEFPHWFLSVPNNLSAPEK